MVHEAAKRGYQQKSAAYANGRPEYHPEAIATMLDTCGSARWLDIGAGTGIATAALVASGADIAAVEPVEAMRQVLSAALPHVRVLDGTSESLPVPDASASVALAAQAFHWFDHAAALDEIVRALDETGMLVTLWNVRDESVPWVAAYSEISNRHAGTTPRFHTMDWRRAIESDPRFSLAHEQRWPNPQPSSPDRVVARLLSTSFIAALDDATQHGLADDLRRIVAPLGSTFDYPYETQVQIWQRV